MRQYYELMDAVKEYLQQNPNVNTINEGDFFKLDLSKESIFPLLNLDVVNVEFNEHFNRYNLQVIAADIVDSNFKNKKEQVNVFHGSTNLQDIYNTQLTVVNMLQLSLKRGSLNYEDYVLNEDESSTAVPFEQRFENLLAGWVLNVTVDIPNDEICVD